MKADRDRLAAAGIENPTRELRILTDHFSPDELPHAIKRRANREPMSHILGYREFWRDRFRVTSAVLDPRPDSETMIEAVLAHQRVVTKILDLGCGSGALGLSLKRERPDADLLLADISGEALKIARENARNLKIPAQFVQTNWFDEITGMFDCILCNPPYVTIDEMNAVEPELAYEPKIALTDGGDGLSVYRLLASKAGEHLSQDGFLWVEHGFEQQEQVFEIFQEHGYLGEKYHDLSGKPRICAFWR